MPARLTRGVATDRGWFAAFSLLENMIALAILSIGLLGSARLFSEALVELNSNANRRAATLAAEELINHLRTARADIAPGVSAACMIAVDLCYDDSNIETWLADWRRRLLHRLPDSHAVVSSSKLGAAHAYHFEIAWTGRNKRSESQHYEIVWRK